MRLGSVTVGRGAGVVVGALLCAVVLLAIAAPRAGAVGFTSEWGSEGSGNGQFETPQGIGIASGGDVYVADTGNDRIQRFGPTGAYVSKWGIFGAENGEFSGPVDVALDFADNVYVLDSGNARVQKFGPTGNFLTKWGGFGAGPGQFAGPTGIVVGPSGSVYVVDASHYRVQKFDSGGAFITQWGAQGTGPGQFGTMAEIGVDFAGDVYVADSSNDRVQEFDSNGAFITAWGMQGSGNGQFDGPYDVAIDSGTVHVTDMNNHRVESFSTSGVFEATTGSQGSGLGQFQYPSGIAVGSVNQVYVTDTLNHRVQFGPRSGIIVRKDSIPDDPQVFDFTTGGGLSPPSFQLDDDGNPATGFPNSVGIPAEPGSGYSVAESVPPGWDQVSATCSDGSPVTNIDVSADEQIICTFTNRKRGRIVVVQDSQPDASQDFSFTAGGGLTPSSFTLDDDGDAGNGVSNTQSFEDLLPGSGYSVSQSTPAGWGTAEVTCSDGSTPANIDVAAGETVTCTFVNVSTNAGRIIVTKDAQPNDPQDFSFTAGGGLSPSSFQLDDDGNAGNALSNTRTFVVAPDSGYSVAESEPAGWFAASATCSDGSPVSNIDVSPAETVTCTFTNQRRGTIVVVEDSQPDDPQEFSFTAGGGLSPSSFTLDDDGSDDNGVSSTRTFVDVAPGNGYSLAEAPQVAWDESGTCSDGSPVSNIDVAPAETVTCTFTNRKHGKIVVVKNAQPDDPQDFSFTAGGGLSPSSFTLDDDGDSGNGVSNTQVFDEVSPGSGYSVAESTPGDWVLEPTCSDDSPIANITVSPAEIVTCTFTNSRPATLTVVLDAQPNDPQDFSFSTGGFSPASFQLDDDGDNGNGLASTRTFTGLVPHSGYSVTQSPVPTWLQRDATCSDGSSPSDIDLAPGENVTCTFVVSHEARIVAAKDARPNDSTDFDFTAGGGLSPPSFSLDDDGNDGNGLSHTRGFVVAPGTGYSLAESTPPGPWQLDSSSCSDGSPPSNIDAAAGETVTCTFVNLLEGYVRPRGASPMSASLVPAARQCTAPNRTHGAPLAFPSCNPVVQASSYLTIGSPDANGAGANFTGFVKLVAHPGAPGGPDDADVNIRSTITDMRCTAATSAAVCSGANAGDGPDYSGGLEAMLTIEVTDKSGGIPATTQKLPVPIDLSCTNTPSTATGGLCSVITTVDTVLPGAVREGERAIWGLDPIQVSDGGADGLTSTAGNTLILTQGVFTP